MSSAAAVEVAIVVDKALRQSESREKALRGRHRCQGVSSPTFSFSFWTPRDPLLGKPGRPVEEALTNPLASPLRNKYSNKNQDKKIGQAQTNM